jgi:hypothetical protein
MSALTEMVSADVVVAVGMLLLFASVVTPNYAQRMDQRVATPLPIESTPDVRRWRHNGEQPFTDQSNRAQTVEWPEVNELI